MKIAIFILSLGLFVVLTCMFLPLSTSCELTENDEVLITYRYGFLTPTFYIGVIFLLLVIFHSFIRKDSFTSSLVSLIIYSVIGTSLLFFLDGIGKAGWGKPCGNSPTQYKNIFYLGYFLVIFSAFMTILNKRKKQKKMESIDLIDNFN